MLEEKYRKIVKMYSYEYAPGAWGSYFFIVMLMILRKSLLLEPSGVEMTSCVCVCVCVRVRMHTCMQSGGGWTACLLAPMHLLRLSRIPV